MPKPDRLVSVLCTLGPASLNRSTIERLTVRGVHLFRINLSHTPLEKVEETVEFIRSISDVPICLDTEGAQVRTGPMEPGVIVRDRQRVVLGPVNGPGSASRVGLTPPSVLAELAPNTLVALDFDGVVLLVVGLGADGGLDTVVLNGGRIGSNKAVVVDPAPSLPPLSAKDVEAVRIGMRLGVRHYALSFANSPDDVRLLRSMAGPDATIVSKIESRRGVRNIDGILAESDQILIDRGDLSREVPLENLPFLQKALIRKANFAKVPVNVATNLLESMTVNSKPTRAELNDIVNTLLDGANGLVLAAETAIGAHPVGAVDMVLGLIERYKRSLDGYRTDDLLEDDTASPRSLPDVPTPARQRPSAATGSTGFPAIELNPETALDVEQLLRGVYAPLRGFLTREELESVLDRHTLPDGQVWTMPIVLQGRSQEFAAFHAGQSVRLIDSRTGQAIAVMHIDGKFEVDPEDISRRWFGTADRAHPGVARFFRRGFTLLGGAVEAIDTAPPAHSPHELTPRQARAVFDIKGWTKIVAFQSRGVAHRAHEHVIAHACERCNADGILVQPLIGPEQAGSFTSRAVVASYERLILDGPPNTVLGTLSSYPRFSDARGKVFAALCGRNFGCTHMVFGPDRSRGEGGGLTRGLFETLGDIGITPVFFEPVRFSAQAGATVESAASNGLQAISSDQVRDLLARNQPIPEWCMRPDIASLLLEMRNAGEPVLTP